MNTYVFKVKKTPEKRAVNKTAIFGYIFCYIDAYTWNPIMRIKSLKTTPFYTFSIIQSKVRVNKKVRQPYTKKYYWQGWRDKWVLDNENKL